MGKYGKYEKKYKKSWETLPEMQGWLLQAPPGHPKEGEAMCRLCKITMRPQLADLKKHGLTKQHSDKMASLNRTTQPTLGNYGVASTSSISDQSKSIDLKLALYIAMHSSIRSIDHLGELLKSIGLGTKLENLRLHRTKCTALIKSVLAPAMLTALIEDVGSNGYSLIVDESTDVSVSKYMCMCIRYYSDSQQKIVTDYLGIFEVVRATSDDLFKALCLYLNTVGLKLDNIVGLGTDGGSNLCGRNHSLFTLIREKVPTVQLIKCVCHSIHICSSKASEELPSSVDFLIRETYSWFSCSSLRRHAYKDIYAAINNGEKPLQMIQLSQTRWLARYSAVNRILDQWHELKAHFLIAATNEKCYSARLLSEMYNDPTNHLYLLFLKPILQEMHFVNLNFQHTTADVTQAYVDLKLLLMSVSNKIIKSSFLDTKARGNQMLELDDVGCVDRALQNPLSLLPYASVDHGVLFNSQLTSGNCKVSDEKLQLVKQRCFGFLKKLCEELVKRLPENMNAVNALKNFTPVVCLNQVRPTIQSLPLQLLDNDMKNKLDVLEIQWQKLLAVTWADHFPGGKIETDTVKFWIFLRSFKDAGGRLVFKDLSMFALKLLSLPFSNAVVERAFSVMNTTKTKGRNRIKMDTLDALMRIRIHSAVSSICCNNFVPTKGMLKAFTSDMYVGLTNPQPSEENETGTADQDMEEFMELFPSEDLDHIPVFSISE